MAKISNEWFENMPAHTIKGNPGDTSGVPIDIPIADLASGDFDGGRADSLYLVEDDFDCGGA